MVNQKMESYKTSTLTLEEAQSRYRNDKIFRIKAYFKWWGKYIAFFAIFILLFGVGLLGSQALNNQYNHILLVALSPLSLCIALYISYKIANPFKCTACGSESVRTIRPPFYCEFCGMSYFIKCLSNMMYQTEAIERYGILNSHKRKESASDEHIRLWELFFKVPMPEDLKNILLQENGIEAPHIKVEDIVMLFGSEEAMVMYEVHKLRRFCSDAIPVAMNSTGDLIVYQAVDGKVDNTYLMKSSSPNWDDAVRINVDLSLLN
jgi:hypothetical protein